MQRNNMCVKLQEAPLRDFRDFFNFIFFQFDTKPQNREIKYSHEIRNLQYTVYHIKLNALHLKLYFAILMTFTKKKPPPQMVLAKLNFFSPFFSNDS